VMLPRFSALRSNGFFIESSGISVPLKGGMRS
jgi:hypothetical protein